MTRLLEESERLRGQLARLLEEDAQAYTEVSNTMRLPRDTEEQERERATELEAALKAATNVPLRIAEACTAVIGLCWPAAEQGNVNAVSDAGVAVLMAEAGLRAAALNVLINLVRIKDPTFVQDKRARLDALLEGSAVQRDEVYGFVVSKL
jgi:formiminotetrahydrofolate cyclodeaminase